MKVWKLPTAALVSLFVFSLTSLVHAAPAACVEIEDAAQTDALADSNAQYNAAVSVYAQIAADESDEDCEEAEEAQPAATMDSPQTEQIFGAGPSVGTRQQMALGQAKPAVKPPPPKTPKKLCRRPGNLCPDGRAPACVKLYPPIDPSDKYNKGGVCCPAGQIAVGENECAAGGQICKLPTPPPPPRRPVSANSCAIFVATPKSSVLCGQGNKYNRCMNCCNNTTTEILQPTIPPSMRPACEASCGRVYDRNGDD